MTKLEQVLQSDLYIELGKEKVLSIIKDIREEEYLYFLCNMFQAKLQDQDIYTSKELIQEFFNIFRPPHATREYHNSFWCLGDEHIPKRRGVLDVIINTLEELEEILG